MRKVIYCIFLFAGFIASCFIVKSPVQAQPVSGNNLAIDNACDAGLVFTDILKNQDGTLTAGHYSHRSHSSHSSHRSHYSSRF